MAARCREVVEAVERLAPPRLAEDWDNCGLLLGDPEAQVQKVLVALEVTEEVAGEAELIGAQMIIAHHPLFLEPVKTLRLDRPLGRLAGRLIRAGITVYACHTSLDNAPGGVGDALASTLGLERVEVLGPGRPGKLYKLAVFIPEGHEGKVRDALGDAGAGFIGNYSHCTFRSPGTGTFKPLSGSSPFIGKQGKLEEVREYRLETILPEERLEAAMAAMLAVHPYEEVAYDLYPLANRGASFSYGRLGCLAEPLALGELAELVKRKLGARNLRLAGDAGSVVERVAVAGGSGAAFLAEAAARGAQVLITGDVKYHQALEARAFGLAVLDAGHYATERPAIDFLAAHLTEALQEKEVLALISQVCTDPWA